jgi:hypothetical protein
LLVFYGDTPNKGEANFNKTNMNDTKPEKDIKNREPLFTRRKNGFGWDLNIGSPTSYVILAIILAIPFVVVAYCIFAVKK